MALIFSNISKTYSNNETATLKDINLEIGNGEF
ncbi:MAG TPA: nitrate ABC transporter ATP-binding protein, partial [Lachnospiraceae bacterium]|nr:nitrate ABC transporter ATP-binding protein [Lachnospiraceae bacterium]